MTAFSFSHYHPAFFTISFLSLLLGNSLHLSFRYFAPLSVRCPSAFLLLFWLATNSNKTQWPTAYVPYFLQRQMGYQQLFHWLYHVNNALELHSLIDVHLVFLPRPHVWIVSILRYPFIAVTNTKCLTCREQLLLEKHTVPYNRRLRYVNVKWKDWDSYELTEYVHFKLQLEVYIMDIHKSVTHLN